MEGDRFRRARLCRLCNCPVVDGGIYIHQRRRMDKLRRWWKAHFDTDLEDKTGFACYFCVWDLRILEEHYEEKELPDQVWWPKYEKHKNTKRKYYKYYTDGWMKPCSVKMTPLANEHKLLEEYRQKGFGHRHRCLFCPQSYATHQNLVIHIKTVHPKTFFYCTKINCGKFFHSEEEKAKHTSKDHQCTKESLKCVYCKKVSTNKSNHEAHLLKHHRRQIIRCPEVPCKLMFKSKEERDKHVDNFHNSGKYLCCFCDRYFKCHKSQWGHMKVHHKEALKCKATRACPNYFKTEEDRQKHMLKCHSKKYECLYCSVSYSKSGALSTHIRRLHKDVALRCEYSLQCTTWFKTEEERQKHYKEDHESGDDKVVCPLCDKKFLKKDGRIAVHFRTHHKKDKILKCDYAYLCANYFCCEEDKLKHIQEVHENLDEKFRCVYCQKFIPNRMCYHIKKWHKDVAIKCNFHEKCPNYFKTLEDRDNHLREGHLAEKIRQKAPCLYCDKILAGKNALGSHIKLNHPDIAIKCQYPQCGTFFKSQEDLENHFCLKLDLKQPLKKELFNCAVCQKSFHYKSELKNHIKTKHRRTKKMCPHCKKTTSNKRDHIISNFCKVCNQKFQCLGLLRSHTLKCKPIFHCPVCSKSFKMECQVNYHCKMKHTVPILKWKGLQFESRGFKCEDCLIFFCSKNVLQAHTRLTHGATIFTCDFCKKKCPNKVSVKYHISRNHLGLMTFYCPVCNRKLDSEKRVKRHVQNNCNKANLVQCQICAKLMTPLALKVHIKHIH